MLGAACGDGEPDSTAQTGDGDGDTPPVCSSTQEVCDGVCTSIASDPDNCGGCDIECASGEACSEGTCQALECASNQELCDGFCASTASDPDNCGACGEACGEGEGCLDGECADFGCGTSQVECLGVCVSLLTDEQNCGDCGESCDLGDSCINGVCELTCPEGSLACNGACIDPLTDRDYCGADACPDLGAGGASGTDTGVACESGQVCTDGECVLSCPSGHLACDGACVDPSKDREYCGAQSCDEGGPGSASACSSGEVCSAGSCETSCQAGLLECGGLCINPDRDLEYCGATTCEEGGPGSATACESGEVCSGGTCETSCPANMFECGGTCINPLKDLQYCGAPTCGDGGPGSSFECESGEVCSEGSCEATCQPGLLECDGLCINPDRDIEYCGASTCEEGGPGSATACESGEVCSGGSCETSCPVDLLQCGGTCIDPQKDLQYCGASTCEEGGPGSISECDPGEVCSAGVCEASCMSGLLECGGTCINPLTDPDYCGATDCSAFPTSGTNCTSEQSCVGGECREVEFEWTQGVGIDEAGATTGTNEHGLGTDANGNAIVIWRQYTSGTADDSLRVFGRRYNAATKSWGAVTRLDESPVRVRNLALDVNASGRAVAAWLRDTSASETQVWMTRFNPVNLTWSDPVRADETVSLKNTPDVGIDSLGNVHIAWSEQIGGASFRIVRNYYDAGGAAFSGATTITGYAGEVGSSSLPAIDVNAAGDAALVWREGLFTSGVGNRAVATVFEEGPDTWSTPVDLVVHADPMDPADGIYNGTGPIDVGIDASGNAYAVWSQRRTGTPATFDVMMSKYTGSWSVGTPVETVAAIARRPRIVTSDDGNSTVTFDAGGPSGPYEVRAILVTPLLAFSEFSLDANVATPSLVNPGRDQDGNTFVTWIAGGHVRLASADAVGQWQSAINLTQTNSPGATDPHAATAAGGRAYATWHQNGDIVFARYD